jgi:hypothetical protein
MPLHPQTSVRIAAPVSTVWRVLLDVKTYPEWNPAGQFHTSPTPGRRVRMTVRLFGRGLTVPVLTLAVEPGRELCRRGGARGLMTGTHYFKLEPEGDAATLVTHGERFAGLGAPLLWPFLARELHAFYNRINVALKSRCEAQHVIPAERA